MHSLLSETLMSPLQVCPLHYPISRDHRARLHAHTERYQPLKLGLGHARRIAYDLYRALRGGADDGGTGGDDGGASLHHPLDHSLLPDEASTAQVPSAEKRPWRLGLDAVRGRCHAPDPGCGVGDGGGPCWLVAFWRFSVDLAAWSPIRLRAAGRSLTAHWLVSLWEEKTLGSRHDRDSTVIVACLTLRTIETMWNASMQSLAEHWRRRYWQRHHQHSFDDRHQPRLLAAFGPNGGYCAKAGWSDGSIALSGTDHARRLP